LRFAAAPRTCTWSAWFAGGICGGSRGAHFVGLVGAALRSCGLLCACVHAPPYLYLRSKHRPSPLHCRGKLALFSSAVETFAPPLSTICYPPCACQLHQTRTESAPLVAIARWPFAPHAIYLLKKPPGPPGPGNNPISFRVHRCTPVLLNTCNRLSILLLSSSIKC
jgi:hypothetical protein